MFELTKYRTIIRGLEVLSVEMSSKQDLMDAVLLNGYSAVNHLELCAYRDDFKDLVERLCVSLVEFRSQVISDRNQLTHEIAEWRRAGQALEAHRKAQRRAKKIPSIKSTPQEKTPPHEGSPF